MKLPYPNFILDPDYGCDGVTINIIDSSVMTTNATLYGEQYITIFDIDPVIQIDSVFIELDSVYVDSTFYVDSIFVDCVIVGVSPLFLLGVKIPQL